jgi:hypothetical protein
VSKGVGVRVPLGLQFDIFINIKQIIKALLREELDNTMVYWHGGNLDNYSDFIAQKGGRYEYGVGLYLTKKYDVAKRYSKGSRKLYQVTVAKGNDIQNAYISIENAIKFVKQYVISRLKKLVIEAIKSHDKNGQINAYIFNNIILNNKSIPSSKTTELRKFLVNNNIDYDKMDSSRMGPMMVLYNMKKIVNIKRIGPKDKIEKFDLD